MQLMIDKTSHIQGMKNGTNLLAFGEIACT